MRWLYGRPCCIRSWVRFMREAATICMARVLFCVVCTLAIFFLISRPAAISLSVSLSASAMAYS